MEAPQIGPANIASRPTVAPMTNPAVIPFSRAPIDTCRITSMRKKVSKVSNTRLCEAGPDGTVAPSPFAAGKSHRNSALADKAPAH